MQKKTQKSVSVVEGFPTKKLCEFGQLNNQQIAGWWCNNHLEKYEFVNGKDDITHI